MGMCVHELMCPCVTHVVTCACAAVHVSWGVLHPRSCDECRICSVPPTGEVSASQALRTACEDLKDVSTHMMSTFEQAVKKYKEEHPDWDKQLNIARTGSSSSME